MTPQEIAITRARIAELDAILSSGASSSTLDGTTISFDLAAMRQERDELKTKLQTGNKPRRNAFNVKLG